MRIDFVVGGQEAGLKLGLFLRYRNASASLIRSVKFTEGGLRVNGQQARTNLVLNEGDRVLVQLPRLEEYSAEPEDFPLQIIYESQHAMVVNKPAGMLIHPARFRRGNTLANAFCGLMQKRGVTATFRPVGRLDANTSGLVLCAMNAYAAPVLGKTMQKAYFALAEGRMEGKGCIESPLAAAENSFIKQIVSPNGKPSRTEYEVLSATQGGSLAAVWPKTGRTHQIRTHFASIGHPLLGDELYGGNTEQISRHALHCAWLAFTEPDGQVRELSLDLPADMMLAARQLGIAETACHAISRLGLPKFNLECIIGES